MQFLARFRGLRYGFLVRPLGLAFAFGVLAVVVVAIDRSAGPNGVDFGYSSGAEGGRSLLSTIAASLITVAGVTFSIMIVALQLVSQQFSPRALQTFLGDRLNQFVAGYFTGVFVYCLLVLRTIESPGEDGELFVPALGISVAILLALGALALLLVFIDRMTRRIQVSTIAARVARETLGAVNELYPEEAGQPDDEADAAEQLERWRKLGPPLCVYTRRPGFVTAVDIESLVGDPPGARFHLRAAPGDFVTEGDPVAEVWDAGEAEAVEARVRRAVVLRDERDISQDAGYGLRQLTDIAIRALSPSLNDPTTAWTCVKYVRAVVERLAGRAFPARVRRNGDGEASLVVRRPGWDEYVDTAFSQVARYASDPRVAGALLEAVLAAADAAREAGAHERVAPLARIADEVEEAVEPVGPSGRARIAGLAARVRALAAE